MSMLSLFSQFAVFEALYTKWDTPFMREELPYTFGLQYRVVLAGLASATSRAVIESPIEYAKVKRQTGQSWQLGHIYQGIAACWVLLFD